jgi:RecA-family ATPase
MSTIKKSGTPKQKKMRKSLDEVIGVNKIRPPILRSDPRSRHHSEYLREKWNRAESKIARVELRSRGLDVQYAVRMGYEPLTAAETKAEIHQDCGPTIAIRCFRANGKIRKHRRFRLLDPEKIKRIGRRYTQASGTGAMMHLRVPETISKAYKDITFITEGELKADVIADALKAKVLSIPGVTCHRKDGRLHPHIAAAIDSDQNDKIKEVRKPLLELLDDLKARGITVVVGDVPNLPNREKTGWDDYIQEKGAQAARDIPVHDDDSEKILLWRKTVEPFKKLTATLPESLRNIEPNGREWFQNDPPPQDPVIKPYLNMGESALIVGQGSVGKNFVMTPFLLAVATGTKFFGYPSAEPRRCMYAMLERSEAMFMRRFHKIANHFHSKLPENEKKNALALIAQNIILRSLSGEKLSLIEFANNQWKAAPVVDELIEEIIAAQIEVVFLDPLSRLHGGAENDASVAAAFSNALEKITQKTGAAVVVIHHAGKELRSDMYSGRGSSGWNDNMSQTIVLSIIGPEERKKLKLKDELKEHEKLYDIVRMSHQRCSDGARAPDMKLLRDGETGIFRMINGDRKTVEDIFEEMLKTLRPWAERHHYGFTLNAFRDHRALFKKDMTKREAEKIFNDAVEAEALLPVMVNKDGTQVHKDKNGGLLYQLVELIERPVQKALTPKTVQKPSLPALFQKSGRLRRKERKTRKTVRKK